MGLGVHPFGDSRIVDDFSKVPVPIDARQFHIYQAEWTPEYVKFLIDGDLVKTVWQSPSYPMQLMLSAYEFPGSLEAESPDKSYPKRFVIDYVRGYRRVD